jgi:hypothetical protein
MNRIMLVVLLCCIAQVPTRVDAQTQQRPPISQEYIQSVSPVAGGGSIVSRSIPGQTVQTVTTVSQFPPTSNINPAIGYQPLRYQGQWSSQANPGNGYLYPSSNSTFATPQPTNTLGYRPVGNPTVQQPGMYQSPNNQGAQNCPTCLGARTTTTTTNYPVQISSPIPPSQIQSGIANTPPTISPPPSLLAPQPVYAPSNNWQTGGPYDPNLVASSGTNSAAKKSCDPVVALRNLPPATYIGQGIFGQPKAYIDGEPIRNFFRYLTY